MKESNNNRIPRKWEYISSFLQKNGIDNLYSKKLDEIIVNEFGDVNTEEWIRFYTILESLKQYLSEKSMANAIHRIATSYFTCTACMDTVEAVGQIECSVCRIIDQIDECNNSHSMLHKALTEIRELEDSSIDEDNEFVFDEFVIGYWLHVVVEYKLNGDYIITSMMDFLRDNYLDGLIHTKEWIEAGINNTRNDLFEHPEWMVACKIHRGNCDECKFGKEFGSCHEKSSMFQSVKRRILGL